MITKQGYKELLENLTLSSVTPEKLVTQMIVGNGVGIESDEDTELSGTQTELIPVTTDFESEGVLIITGILPYNKFNGYTLSEIGLLTKTGTLFARKVLAQANQHEKTMEHQVEINWKLTAF